MNECIGHVIGKPHSPVTGLYLGKAEVTGVCSGTLLLLLQNFGCKVLLKFQKYQHKYFQSICDC